KPDQRGQEAPHRESADRREVVATAARVGQTRSLGEVHAVDQYLQCGRNAERKCPRNRSDAGPYCADRKKNACDAGRWKRGDGEPNGERGAVPTRFGRVWIVRSDPGRGFGRGGQRNVQARSGVHGLPRFPEVLPKKYRK